MITSVEEFEHQFNIVNKEYKRRIVDLNRYDGPVENEFFDIICLNKPIHFLTNNIDIVEQKIIDKGLYYECTVPRFGHLNKKYKNDFTWILDEDSLLVVERPDDDLFTKFLYSILDDEYKSLLTSINNDVMIGNVKIGPTYYCGKKGGMVSLIRLRNAKKLDKIFKGDANHEKRKNNFKYPLGSLDQFCSLTKDEIIDAFYKFKAKLLDNKININVVTNDVTIKEEVSVEWNGSQQQME